MEDGIEQHLSLLTNMIVKEKKEEKVTLREPIQKDTHTHETSEPIEQTKEKQEKKEKQD
jgi:hypothetical protein